MTKGHTVIMCIVHFRLYVQDGDTTGESKGHSNYKNVMVL